MPEDHRFASPAEQVTYEALRSALPGAAEIVPNLWFSAAEQDCEGDLVVLWPGVGVAVIEVKGGQVAYSRQEWTQSGREGTHRIRPVDQAREAKHLLRKYLKAHPDWVRPDPRLAHLVAFPFTTVHDDFEAPDCPRWRVVDRGDLAAVAARVRTALEETGGPGPPTGPDVKDMLEILEGRPIPQRSSVDPVRVADVAAEREATVELLTADQARILDQLRAANRVEIRGGAGSGKTWLAVEQAKRLTRAGRRVGLLCYSRGLASYLQQRVGTMKPRERPAYVGTFHGLAGDWLGQPMAENNEPEFWEHHLPAEMARLAAARPEPERFDAFVVDEAQDFADAWWPALLSSLRDPGTGGLFVLADERQRVFARQGRPPVALFPLTLDENLRNTRQIAQVFGSLTGEQMRYRGGDGPPVRFVPCATEDAETVADDEAVDLLTAGWAHQHVALLTTGHRHPMQVEQQAAGQAEYWRSFWAGDDLFYGHVLGFKGLERPAVVLAVNGFQSPERAAEMLYVGLSRARDLLVVCGDPALVTEAGGPAVAKRLGLA